MRETIENILMCVGLMVGFIALVMLCVFPFAWVTAKQQQAIYAREYNKHYSTWELVWASSAIENIVLGTRQRLDVTLEQR